QTPAIHDIRTSQWSRGAGTRRRNHDFDPVLGTSAVAYTSYQTERAASRDGGFYAKREGLVAMGSRNPSDPGFVVTGIVARGRCSDRLVFSWRIGGPRGRAVPCGDIVDFPRAPHAPSDVVFT